MNQSMSARSMSPQKSIAAISILINRRSGTVIEEGESKVMEAVSRICKEAGLESHDIQMSEPEDVDGHIQRLVSAGVDRIIVGGGDGTLGTAAQSCFFADVTLGILPMGTCNFFARDLGLPAQFEEALRVQLRSQETRKVDVGSVNGKVFINAVTLGAYSKAVEIRENARRESDTYRWSDVGLKLLGMLNDIPKVRVRSDSFANCDWQLTPLLFIGNNEYRTSLSDFGKRSRVDEGKLHVVMTDEPTLAALANLVTHTISRDASDSTAVDSSKVGRIEIEVEQEHVVLTLDGERKEMASPLIFRSLQGALQVISPEL